MISSLARFLDSLFYTTTITTVTTTVTTYDRPDEFNGVIGSLKDRGFDVTDNRTLMPSGKPILLLDEDGSVVLSIDDTDDQYQINGAFYPIPKVVRDKPPIMIDGKPNFESFPTYRHATFLSQAISNDRSLMYADGHLLSRTVGYHGWTRTSATKILDETIDKISDGKIVSTETVRFSDTDLVLSVLENASHLTVRFSDGSAIIVYQDTKAATSPSSCVTHAHALARVVLLTMLAAGDDADVLVERDLVNALLSMLICAEG